MQQQRIFQGTVGCSIMLARTNRYYFDSYPQVSKPQVASTWLSQGQYITVGLVLDMFLITATTTLRLYCDAY